MRESFWILAGAVALAIAAAGCQHIGMSTISADEAAGFEQVKPILESRCLPCHQGDYMGATLPDFRTAADLFDPDRNPALIVPGDPEGSRLLQVVYAVDDGEVTMPPVGHGLAIGEKDLIGEWIRRGAIWPDGEVLQSEALRDRSLRR